MKRAGEKKRCVVMVTWLRTLFKRMCARWLPADRTASSSYFLTFISSHCQGHMYTGWFLATNWEQRWYRAGPFLPVPRTSLLGNQCSKTGLTNTFLGPPQQKAPPSQFVLLFLLSWVSSVRHQWHIHLRGLPLLPPLFIFYIHFSHKSFAYLDPNWYLLFRCPKVTKKVRSMKENIQFSPWRKISIYFNYFYSLPLKDNKQDL